MPTPLEAADIESLLHPFLVSTDEDEHDGTTKHVTSDRRQRRVRRDRTSAAQAVFDMLDKAADHRTHGRYKGPKIVPTYANTSKQSRDRTFTHLRENPTLSWAYRPVSQEEAVAFSVSCTRMERLREHVAGLH